MRTAVFPALGTTAVVVLGDGPLAEAEALVRAEVRAVDEACSRFRADSEISAVHRAAGRTVEVSPLLAEAVGTALRAAELTGGLVDPTVGTALCALGYDRDFAQVRRIDPRPVEPVPAPGWWRVGLDAAGSRLVVPRGVLLDLGATAKALCADRAARAVSAALGCGVLVSLGGDLATAGTPPEGGWHIGVGDDHVGLASQIVTIRSGGLATSGTVRRRWKRAGRVVHHIVDPRTGDVPAPCWRTASVVAVDCVTGNTASTAAVLLGEDAPAWLAERGLHARLVGEDGRVVEVGGWPAEGRSAA
ncbi:FAD:protein FMN transferase [Actinosynnema pretiosum]|uniref:FAD:protein FMN transferase n=1 Tax=Actinosynnema pretiosum TaxID=42197 RepID=UPI001E5CD033|nr:FAD:protein FMN transferase [Actinosynnema pretiosum]